MVENLRTPEVQREPRVFHDLSWEELKNHALQKDEYREKYHVTQIQYEDETGIHEGAISMVTEKSKRFKQDKYYVKRSENEGKIWEEINNPMSEEHFDVLFTDVQEHLKKDDLFVQNVAIGVPLRKGEDPSMQVRLLLQFRTNSPLHAVFPGIQFDQLTPEEKLQVEKDNYKPDMTFYHAPDFSANPERHGTKSDTTTKGRTAIVNDFEKRRALLIGTDYAGEEKKDTLSVLNEFVAQFNEVTEEQMHAQFPELSEYAIYDTIAVMHGSIYQKADGTCLLVKGGSGAGKSSSLRPPGKKQLEAGERTGGDDLIVAKMKVEDVRNEDGTISKEVTTITQNPENGGYLTSANFKDEPHFAKAAVKAGALLENVIVDPVTRRVDFGDTSITKNARAAVPLDLLSGYTENRTTGAVTEVALVIPDVRGILDPVIRLTDEFQLLLFDVVGWGADMPDRSDGVADVKESFVSYYMDPFLTREPKTVLSAHYRMYKGNNTQGYLVSSGWRGGPYGVGKRPPVEYTQASMDAIISGDLKDAKWTRDPIFGYEYLAQEGNEHLDPKLLAESNAWENPAEKLKQKIEVAKLIREKFYKLFPEGSHPLRKDLEARLPQIPNVEEHVLFTA